MNVQNQTKIEGIDRRKAPTPTPATSTSAASKSSRLAAPATMPSNFAPGASLSHQREVGRRSLHRQLVQRLARRRTTIADNLPDNLRVANQRDENGFFVRAPLAQGNPVDQQYDINFNVGGPLWKKRAWFFYSYRLDDQYKVVLGFPELARSKLTNDYTVQGHVPAESEQPDDRLHTTSATSCRIGATSVRRLRSARRGIRRRRTTPRRSSGRACSTAAMFLDVLYGDWGNFFPLRPTNEQDIYRRPVGSRPTGHWQQPALRRRRATTPTRIRSATSRSSTSSLSYFKQGWKGNHDFKFGFDKKRTAATSSRTSRSTSSIVT